MVSCMNVQGCFVLEGKLVMRPIKKTSVFFNY